MRSKRIKILMSAYACEPDRGSEPAVGWNWAMAMSKHTDVTVVTRANNQEIIEGTTGIQDDEFESPTFIYYDPPKFIVRLKKSGLIPVHIFYLIWQAGAWFKMRKELKNFDLVHHVTFNSMMLPGFWWGSETPVVLGPLGGTSCVSENYRTLYGSKLWKEKFRKLLIQNWNFLPWLRLSFGRANLILCANSETKNYLSSHYPEKTDCMLETGIDKARVIDLAGTNVSDANVVRFIWVGAIEPWKALSLTLRALSIMKERYSGTCDILLDVVGDGSELEEAKIESRGLGLDRSTVFHGAKPLDETQRMIKSSDVLIFSSIKDTSGNVVLEAMGMAKPVICLNHQGVKDITTAETAIRVDPGTIPHTVESMAHAMIRLASSPELRGEMGNAGRCRILEHYTWNVKSKKMSDFYSNVVNGSGTTN